MRVKALVSLNKASRCGSRVFEGTEEKVKLSCFFYYYNYILDFYYLFHFLLQSLVAVQIYSHLKMIPIRKTSFIQGKNRMN